MRYCSLAQSLAWRTQPPQPNERNGYTAHLQSGASRKTDTKTTAQSLAWPRQPPQPNERCLFLYYFFCALGCACCERVRCGIGSPWHATARPKANHATAAPDTTAHTHTINRPALLILSLFVRVLHNRTQPPPRHTPFVAWLCSVGLWVGCCIQRRAIGGYARRPFSAFAVSFGCRVPSR